MSEGVDALINEFGFAGYGRWNRLLEIVASKMDESGRCHAEYSIQKWCSFLRLKQKKLVSFLELTQNELKTKVVYCENKVRIEIPNLLKKRDNYTKHLQVTSKQLTSIDKEVEVDKEKTVKAKKPSIPKLLFGEHKNVKLTQEEYNKLKAIVMPNQLGLCIESLSDYIKSRGKQYKSHYATLRSWLRRDGLLKTPVKAKSKTLPEVKSENTEEDWKEGKAKVKKIIGSIGNIP